MVWSACSPFSDWKKILEASQEKELELSFLSPDACGQHFPTVATATSDMKPCGKWWSQTNLGFPAALSSGQQTSALSSLPATTGEGTGPHIWTNRYISSQKPNAWKWKVKVNLLSHVRLFATPWTAAYQVPPSLGFSRQEYWSGLPLPSPGKMVRIRYFHCHGSGSIPGQGTEWPK